MKLRIINRYFRKMGVFQVKYRWALLGLIALITVFGFAGLGRVDMVSSNDKWFDKAEEIQIATDKFEELFGSGDSVNLLIESEDVFQPEVLKMIREIGDELLINVPFADEITSLTELEVSVGTEDGMAVINPIGDEIPDNPEELAKLKGFILSRRALVNRIVSDDGTETWISLSLREYPDNWKENGEMDPLYQIGEAAISIVTNEKWSSDKYTIKAAGMPYTETEERDFFGREAFLRVLSGFIAMIFLLLLLLKSLRGLLVPAFATVAGISIVFGFMGWLNIGVDSNFVTLPVLLGMALSVGYSIHLVNTFKRLFRVSGNRKDSAIGSVEETGWPLFFTAVTTMGSVLSFVATGIFPIQWLGFTCAAVVLAVYLYVVILIPIVMSFGKNRQSMVSGNREALKVDLWFERLGEAILRRKRRVTVFFILAVLVIVPGIAKISVNIDSFEMMGLKIPYIQRLYEIVHSKLGSYISYDITVSYDEPDAVKDPRVMKNFETLLQEVGQFELTKSTKGIPKVHSVLEIIKEMNQTLNEDNETFYVLPESRELITQLLFLYEMSGGSGVKNWVDEDYSVLRAQVELERYDANLIVENIAAIEKLGEEMFPGADVTVAGTAIRFASLNKKIVTGELKSFLAALIIICILLTLVFSSIKTGLIGMIPNMTPLIAIGGVMGYFDFQLDMMTMTIMPMLLGIAVDDTIHFINHIKFEFEQCGNYHQSIVRSFKVIGKTLTMTTVILSASFGMYIFSPVTMLAHVGILSALGLITALVANYLMTPILILGAKPFGEEKNIKSEDRESLVLNTILEGD